MKKVLLATTALFLTAGVAAADVSFKGEAKMGIATVGIGSDNLGALDGAHGGGAVVVGDWYLYSNTKLVVDMSAETDGGLTFGATFSIKPGGNEFDLDNDGLTQIDPAVGGSSTVYLEFSGNKISMSNNDFDDLIDDASGDGNDLMYEGTFGAVAVKAVIGSTQEKYGLQVSGTFSNFGVTAIYQDGNGSGGEDYSLKVSYDFGTVDVWAKTESKDAATAVNTIAVNYDNNGITAGVEANDIDEWTVSAGYASGPYSVKAKFDESDNWELTGGYDLGNGAKVEAGVDSDEDAFVGLAFTF